MPSADDAEGDQESSARPGDPGTEAAPIEDEDGSVVHRNIHGIISGTSTTTTNMTPTDPYHETTPLTAPCNGVPNSETQTHAVSSITASRPEHSERSPQPAPTPTSAGSSSAANIRNPSGRTTVELTRTLGPYTCSPTDVASVAGRKSWYTGAAISIFAELRIKRAQQIFNRDVQHLPATLMLSLAEIIEAQKVNESEKVKSLIASLEFYVKRVCAHLLFSFQKDMDHFHHSYHPRRT